MILRGPRPLIDKPTMALVLLGAINVGLIGIFKFDFFHWAFGDWETIAKGFVGVAGTWQLLRQPWFD